MPAGFNQINQPTPKWAKMAFRVFFFTTSIATIVMGVFTEIPAPVQLIIMSSVIKANTLVYAVSKLFGINPDEYKPFQPAAPNDQQLINK